MTTPKTLLAALAATAFLPCFAHAGPVPQPDHVVIVIMENHSYSEIIGNPAAPNINAFANGAAVFAKAPDDAAATRSGSHGLRHPSQGNYLELFSGDNQGVINDGRPGTAAEPSSSPLPFNTPNLAAALIADGYSCISYSEHLPSVGFDGDSYTAAAGQNQYQRKHNPLANWQAADAPANNHVPFATNQPFTAFPTDAAGYAGLPTVSIVVPDEQNDMHDGSIQMGDTWLQNNIFAGYYEWAKTHNSILIVTFDEDDHSTNNQIPTIIGGALVKPGTYFEEDINPLDTRSGAGITLTGTAMNHYNVLRTVEDMFGLNPIGGASGVPALTDIFSPAHVSFANIATRIYTGTGNDVMIGGFIVGGNVPRKVIIRGLGPSLNTEANPLPGALDDPTLELHAADGHIIRANNDWQDTQKAAIQATGIPPQYAVESAMVVSLDPGSYTAILAGKDGGTGIGLVEVYDLEGTGAPTLLNISTRGQVRTGNDVMIGGIIIAGTDYGRVIIRGLGPSLNTEASPLPGALQDPTLDLRDENGAPLAFNDDWQDDQSFEINRTGIAPKNPAEAAIIGSYPPGRYTVILAGGDHTAGIGLIEAYRLN